MKHLILGNGAAGLSAAEKLRLLSDTDEITIVSNEETPAYAKFLLPDFIGGKLAKEKLFLRNPEQYEKNKIRLVLGECFNQIDIRNKRVHFTSGETEEYDKLLLAIGGIPFIPDIQGLKEMEYFTVNSISDAEKIKEKAFAGGKAMIVGSGLTGIEVAFALKRLGMKVTIVEREAIILPQQLDSYSSSVLVDEIRSEGIEMLLGATLQGVSQDEKYTEKTATLSDGREIAFDLLVITIGTRSNIGLIKQTGIECGRGVLVNEFLRSSAEDVYAAGDVAESMNKLSGEYVSSYIWPNAIAQGKCAAQNMCGQEQEFSNTTVMNSAVQLRDIPFISMGMINPKDREYEAVLHHDKDSRVYKKLVIRNNIIKGMILLGDTANATVLGSLIKNGTNVSEFKNRLLDKDFNGK